MGQEDTTVDSHRSSTPPSTQFQQNELSPEDQQPASVTDNRQQMPNLKITLEPESIVEFERNRNLCASIVIDSEDFRSREPGIRGAIDRFTLYQENSSGLVAMAAAEVVRALTDVLPYWESDNRVPNELQNWLVESLAAMDYVCSAFLDVSKYEIEWARLSFKHGGAYAMFDLSRAYLAQFDPKQYSTSDVPCDSGGLCNVGDISPSGGTVIAVLDRPILSGVYLEVAPMGWAQGDDDSLLDTLEVSTANVLGSLPLRDVNGDCKSFTLSEGFPIEPCEMGEEVTVVQTLLRQLGYVTGEDGKNDAQTLAAWGGFEHISSAYEDDVISEQDVEVLRVFATPPMSAFEDPIGTLGPVKSSYCKEDVVGQGTSGWAWPSGKMTTPWGWGAITSVVVARGCSLDTEFSSALNKILSHPIGGYPGWHLPSLFELSVWCSQVTSGNYGSLDGETTEYFGCNGANSTFPGRSSDGPLTSELIEKGIHSWSYLSSTLDGCFESRCFPFLLDFLDGEVSRGSDLSRVGALRPVRWFFPGQLEARVEELPVTYPNHMIP